MKLAIHHTLISREGKFPNFSPEWQYFFFSMLNLRIKFTLGLYARYQKNKNICCSEQKNVEFNSRLSVSFLQRNFLNQVCAITNNSQRTHAHTQIHTHTPVQSPLYISSFTSRICLIYPKSLCQVWPDVQKARSQFF